jgi:NAD(P)-dependent dehydrogenase (short-subunit alcohol dehydrogenase family)
MRLSNRVCLIAGASGTIGRAIARRFHEEGAFLALTYFSRKQPKDETGREPSGDRTFHLALDIRQRNDVATAVQQVVARFGTIHVLVNCTGVLGPIGPTAGISEDEWVGTIETNLFGSFYLTRAVLPIMRAQSQGKIVHFSGGGAAYARPYYTAYSASKTALVRFTESLAEEVRESNIDINAIAPGAVDSHMWDQVRALPNPDPKTVEEVRKMQETGGVPPERAAELAVFLASDRSNGFSGRLVSAVWDNWTTFDQRIPKIMCSEAGTLRRVPLE